MISKEMARADIELFSKILATAHPSLNLYLTAERLKMMTDKIYNNLGDKISVRQLYNQLSDIIDELGCSHTGLMFSPVVYDSLYERPCLFPYPVKWLDNKLLINVNDNDAELGSEVLTINNEPVDKIMRSLAVYNHVEGRHRPMQLDLAGDDFSYEYFLKYGPQTSFNINSRDTFGRSHSLTVAAINLTTWNNKNDDERYYYDRTSISYDLLLDEERHFAILKLTTFAFDIKQQQYAFDHFCENSFELLRMKPRISTLIIDVRENTGGDISNAAQLFSYITDKPFLSYAKAYTKIAAVPFSNSLSASMSETDIEDINTTLSETFTMHGVNGMRISPDSLIDAWTPNKYVFKGKVFVTTNATTMSSGSYFAAMVKNSGRGKVVGQETTGGAYSGNGFNTLYYRLPNSGLKLYFPYVHLLYNYRPDKNTGQAVQPDYLVPDNISSFKRNTDRQVNFIIDSLVMR